jgi:aminoglycoside phosphotransferase
VSSVEDQERQARQLFKDLHRRDPEGREDIVLIGGVAVPTVALQLGRFVGVKYQRLGDGKFYEHEFTQSAQPLIYFGAEGRQMYITKGGYRLTYRGIVD